MTVVELIERLKDFDPDKEIYFGGVVTYHQINFVRQIDDIVEMSEDGV